MAFPDRDHSVRSGHSRASSVQSRAPPPKPKSGPSGGDMFSAASLGVMSMLKTSTDSGDIGDLSFSTNRIPSMPRPAHRRRTNVARLSASSNNSYTPSQVSKRNSNPQTWDAVSAISQATHGTHGTRGRHGRNGSLTSLQTMQTLPPYARDHRSPKRNRPGQPSQHEGRLTAPFSPDGRSYSLTQPQPAFALKPHRSATSLRSQGSGPYPPQRNPYAYPVRLKRPGYQGPSPAQSDFDGPSYPSTYGPNPASTDVQSFESGFDRHHGNPYAHPYSASSRGHPGANRSADGTFYPPPGRNPHRPHMPTYNSDYTSGATPMSRQLGPPSHAQRHVPPGVVPLGFDQNQYGSRTGPARGNPGLAVPPYPATHLPPRLFTPKVDSLPSSSERGSSAPPSSNPPTPKDATTVQVTVDPIFIDPTFGDYPEDQTNIQGLPNYLKYAERVGEVYEMDAVEPAAVELAADPTPARGGFVQRIKDLLEDRSSVKPRESRLPTPQQTFTSVLPSVSAPDIAAEVKVKQEPIELPTRRNSSIHGPVELEAPTRLTRELVKANTAPSSSEQDTGTSQPQEANDNTKPEDNGVLSATSIHELDDSVNLSATMDSSSPHLGSDEASIDATATSKDFSEAAETDFAIQLDIPGPLRPEIANKVRPDSVETTKLDERPLSNPVSPLRPGEEPVRDSLVSPLPTQTLQMPADYEFSKVPGSFPDDQADQPAPPSPKFRPMSGHLSADVSTRFSLPPDLSLLNDHDATSDVVTDIAVQFSVPRTAGHGKPQIVSVSATLESTPNQIETLASSKQVEDSKSLRESFFSVEKVAPLLVNKPDITPVSQTATDSKDLSSFIRRSFPRRQSVWPNDRTDSKRHSSESTETRFPGMKSLNGHLPGLKEESQEDMSIKDYRASGLKLAAPPSFQAKAAYDSFRRSEDASKASYLPARAPRMTLSELRNIPSLNFSRLDLVDKLNEALGSRPPKSVEVTRRGDFSGIYCPSPLRPSSTEALRERYTSFFAKPEDFNVPEPTQGTISEGEGLTTELHTEDMENCQMSSAEPSRYEKGEVLSQQSMRRFSSLGMRTTTPSVRARSPSVRPSSRPLSPDEFISVANEVERLSIPSVAALSARLSDLLPSIKHLMLDSAISDEKAVRETLEEIHQLGSRPGSDALALIRSSTGLRQMAAAADDIATNGTHDSAALDAKLVRLMREMPPLPEDTEKFSLSDDSGLDKNTSLANTEALSSIAATEPEMTKPALLRVKSLNDIEETDQMHPGYTATTTKRSAAPSTHHSRPWNLDEYYPWTGNSVNIDIEFPRPVARRNTSASTVIRRSKVSLDSASEGSETRRTTRARSPLASQSTTILDASPTIDATMYSRKTSKRSLIGSLSRKIGLGGHKTKHGVQPSVLPELPGPTKPGDRYPSTALFPPNTFSLDEVRSFFSESTSNDSDRRGSFRKHIKVLRSRLPGGPLTLSASRIHSIDVERDRSTESQVRASQNGRSASLFDDRFVVEPRAVQQTYEGMAGMGRVEFRVKRVTERLRHVLLKTSEMLRTFSHRGKPGARRLQKERERQQWLDDSLYSGT